MGASAMRCTWAACAILVAAVACQSYLEGATVHELDEAEELIELNQKAFAVKKSQAQVAAELLKAAKIAVKKPKPVKTKAAKKTKAPPKSNLPVDGSKNTWKAFVDPVPKAALNPKRTFLPKTAKEFQLPGKVSKK